MLILRSLLFYLGMILFLCLLLPFMPLALVVPYRARYWLLTRWGRTTLWWLALTCNLRSRVVGREHIPPGPAIIMAKHQSAWETLAFQSIFPPQTWVLKRSLLWIPILGWGLALLHSIAIDRSAGRKALQQVVEQGTDRLQRGIWVIVFPEGTRTLPGQRGKYNIGGAILAKKSGHPVVPVAHNAGEFWPRNGFIKHPGIITIAIGPALQPEDHSAAELTHAVEQWIEDTMPTLSLAAGIREPSIDS